MIDEKSEKIVVVGFGWVGQANALALSRMGFEVFYYDIFTPKHHYSEKYQALYEKIKPLETPLQIDGLNTWYIVCIGDRVSEDGHQDISLIEKALISLRPAKGQVVLRSTVLPKYLKQLSFNIYLPEFLHEINAVEECLNPFIFVIGERNKAVYPDFIKQWEKRAIKIFKGTPEEAAHIKYLSNVWNALRIAFVNEFGDGLALPTNKEQREKIERLIDFFFEKKSYLRYGKTFGGHCLPKDTRAFMAYKEETRPSPLLRAIHESNKQHQLVETAYPLPQWFSGWDYAAYGRGFTRISRRLWQNLNSIKIVKIIRRLFGPLIKLLEKLASKKSLPQLKTRWEKLAKDNPYYYTNSDTKSRQNVDEFELRQTGKNDYLKYVSNDALLQKTLDDFKDKTVLEIGAGVGRMTEFFCQNFNLVHGLDISPSMLAIARRRLAAYPNANLIESAGNTIPLPPEKFDLIFSYLVFKYLPTEKLILDYFKEMSKALKPGGLAKIQLRTGASPYFWQWYCGISLNPAEAKNLAKAAGLEVLKTEIENNKSLWLWLKK
ncbi:MAG: class I SAM-dependent methyltransferase [bacterium]|nr:class I SAM-dependent methyltransferase [bacterium]